MSESKRLQALRALVTAIQSIGTEDDDAYTFRASSVYLDPQAELMIPDSELPAALIHPVPEGEWSYEPALQLAYTFRVEITVLHYAAGGASTDAKTVVAETLLADLERAIVRTLVNAGGEFVDCTLGDPEIAATAGPDPYVALQLPVSIVIHRTYGQP